MIHIKKEGIVLQKTAHGFEREGVLNPGVIATATGIHLFYRAVAKGNYSSIGYARFSDPTTVAERMEVPILFPQHEYESHGVEDPRIAEIEGVFYLSYTAYDGVNALGALATSTDLTAFHKLGLIVPQMTYSEFRHLAESKGPINEKYMRYNERGQEGEKQEKKFLLWDKNVVFFSRKIGGKFLFLHRVRPDIQLVAVENFGDLTHEFWQNYFLHLDEHIVLSPRYDHEISYIGAGCPPVETAEGWLLIYHGVHDTVNGFVYSACAALLDLENPQIELARLSYPLFFPEFEWELIGEVNNVCFPTGTYQDEDRLYIYYGAADERIACVSLSISELIRDLNENRILV